MSADNNEMDIAPQRRGFVEISTVQDTSERGSVQASAKGSFIQMLKRPKCYTNRMGLGAHFADLIDLEQEMGQ